MSIKPLNEIDENENKRFHAEIIIDCNSNPYVFGELTNEHPTVNGYRCSFLERNSFNKPELQNPTEKSPVSIVEFLGNYLDLSLISDVFASRYGKVDYHYRFPLDAMIKSSMEPVREIKHDCLGGHLLPKNRGFSGTKYHFSEKNSEKCEYSDRLYGKKNKIDEILSKTC